MASKRLSGEGEERRASAVGRGRRVRALIGLAACAGLLHLAVLGGLRWTWPRPIASAPQPAVALQVRAVPAAPPPTPAPPSVEAVLAPVPRRALPAGPGRTRPDPPIALSASPAARFDAPAVAPPASARTAAIDDPDDEPPPVYATRLPPPVTLRYDVTRGLATGTGELRWRRDAEGYALDWDSRVGEGELVLMQSSRGRIDAAGIAPTRFVDRRASRAAAAVNFQRDTGRISFSRKSADAVLLPGAQDRLSWLLQLAAIVAADPALRAPGAEVRMTVAGAGGEVAVWRLRCQGLDAADVGHALALRFLREPRGPYDTRAEVWLDPRDGRFLPVRADWRSGPDDDGLSVSLREAVAVTE